MGILNTVIKRSEMTGVSNNLAVVDEKKILLNINSRIEDLKLQNMENAKFLKGISKKIETELSQMREAEENKSIEVSDNSEILSEIDNIINDLNKINENMLNFNSDVILLEIDKVNKALKNINSESVLGEVAKANAKLDEINISDVIKELHRIEELVSEINEKAVLTELERVKQLINEKNSTEVMNKLDAKISQLNSKDYKDELLEIKDLVKKNEEKIDEITKKVDRVSTMPTMIKSVIEKNNEENLARIEELISDLNKREMKKNNSIKMVVNINLWFSLLTAAVLIARILGVV